MTNPFQKAKREKALLRLAIDGTSGSGKTYSSIAIATGIANKIGSRVAVIDTEQHSSNFVADKFDFDSMPLKAPFEPAAFMAAIKDAEANDYKVLVLDSLSHAWNGAGGLLEMKENLAATMRNEWQAWGKITPLQKRLVDAILQFDGHIICTLRTDTEWVVEKDSKGKSNPVKIGTKPQFKAGIEFEFTIVLDIEQSKHMATASKDRTGLFDDKVFVPTIKHGEQIYNWISSGAEPAPQPDPAPEPARESAIPPEGEPIQSTMAEMWLTASNLGITVDAWKAKLAELGITKETQPAPLLFELGQWIESYRSDLQDGAKE